MAATLGVTRTVIFVLLGACLAITVLVLHRQAVGAALLSAAINLRQFVGFLTEAECAAAIDAAKRKGMARSTIAKALKTSDARTSSTVFLARDDDPVVARIFDKVSSLMEVPPSQMEGLQILSYAEGQRYDAHYDPCFKCKADNGHLLREHTVLMYLNDDFEGGATDFPLARCSVAPVKGMAAVFTSMKDGQIIKESKHAGMPVARGTKWLATVWITLPTTAQSSE